MRGLEDTIKRTEFGAWLRIMRFDHKMKKAVVAEKLGCTLSHVSNLEEGFDAVTTVECKKLSELFGVNFTLVVSEARGTILT